jgi:hypothetical protein
VVGSRCPRPTSTTWPIDWPAPSGPTREAGWTEQRVAEAWAELMRRLGYERYGAQGGDVGAGVSPNVGRVAPDRVVVVHFNAATVGFMPFPPLEESELEELSDIEKARVDRIGQFMGDMFGYAQIQSTRPQTSGVLGTSPVRSSQKRAVAKAPTARILTKPPSIHGGRRRRLSGRKARWMAPTSRKGIRASRRT